MSKDIAFHNAVLTPCRLALTLGACLLFSFSSASVAGNEAQESAMSRPRTRQLLAGKKPVRVVIYGDSISEVKPGWNGGAKAPEQNWGAVLVKKLQEAYPDSPFSVHHFAIGGQNTYEGLGRLDGLERFKPDLVLVAFGANDCCYHYLLPEETKLALTTLATEIPKLFGADVVLVGAGGDNPLKPFFKHLDETLQAQKEAARRPRCPSSICARRSSLPPRMASAGPSFTSTKTTATPPTRVMRCGPRLPWQSSASAA